MKNYRDSESLSGGDVLDKIVKNLFHFALNMQKVRKAYFITKCLKKKDVPFCYGVFSCQD